MFIFNYFLVRACGGNPFLSAVVATSPSTMTSTYPPVTGSDRTTTYIPMITPFTASEECSSYFHAELSRISGDLSSTMLYAWWDIFGANNTMEPTCYPDAVTSVFVEQQSQVSKKDKHMAANDYYTFFRLAPFTCPGGWHAVSSGTGGTASTTACCPR